MTASTPLLITFGIYLLLMVGIGFAAWRQTRDFDDYILGGRSLGGYVTALSAGASDMSGWLLMGLPGALYLGGVSEAWIALGLVLGAWANWRFVAGPLRVYTERTDNALTLPDYFTTRFSADGKVLRIASALVILVFFAIYAASGIVAGARLFESVFGLPYAQALWYGAAATILYTLVGGFLAVSWTDTVQATLMIFALILTPLIVVISTGGLGDSLAAIEQLDPAKLDWFKGGELGVVGIISLMAWGLGYCGQPHILARFMAADSLAVIPQARRIGMTWMAISLLGAIGLGIYGRAYFVRNGMTIEDPETIFILLAELLFHPLITGFLFAALLAAIMSTVSSQLLVSSSSLAEDFYRLLLNREASQKTLVLVGRIAVVLVGAVAALIAGDPDSEVLGLVANAWAGFGAAFGPLMILSLTWPRMTGAGAVSGLVVGAATVIIWISLGLNASFLGGPGVYEIIPGFIASFAAIFFVSRATADTGEFRPLTNPAE